MLVSRTKAEVALTSPGRVSFLAASTAPSVTPHSEAYYLRGNDFRCSLHTKVRRSPSLPSFLFCSWLLGILLLRSATFSFLYFIYPCVWRVWAAPRMWGLGFSGKRGGPCSSMSLPASWRWVLLVQGQGPGWVLGSLLKAASVGFSLETWVQGASESCAEVWANSPSLLNYSHWGFSLQNEHFKIDYERLTNNTEVKSRSLAHCPSPVPSHW